MDIQEYADEALHTFLRWEPLSASLLGLHDMGLDGELADWSEQGAAHQRDALVAMRETLRSDFDAASMELQDRVTWDMLDRDIDERIERIDVALEEFAVAPFFMGAQAQILQFVPKASSSRADLADARLERLQAIPRMLGQAADRLSAGVGADRTPPARAARGAIAQIEGYLSSEVSDDVLLGEPPEGLDDPEAWLARGRALLREQVRPAFEAFRDHVRDVVLPAGRPDERSGLTYLDDGAEVYEVLVRQETSTDRSPGEIHELGLGLLERLDEEYAQLGPSVLGTADRDEILRRMRDDPELRYDTRDTMVADARRAIEGAVRAAPHWFGRMPEEGCEVRQVGAHEEESAPPAYYTPPATDGSRPGVYWINTYQPHERQRYLSEAIAFHEAVPGHHFQIALAQHLEDLPLYRRVASINAYQEGWGLYAERLADEMGLYSSDLMRLGMLATDSWRVCRLVVDTGLHHLGWGRQEAIDWMLANSPVDRATIEVEVDRYIAMPGQALGYMVGRIEIERLRRDAVERLGEGFEIAGFHDTLLGSGSVPLTTLAMIVEDWIDRSGTA